MPEENSNTENLNQAQRAIQRIRDSSVVKTHRSHLVLGAGVLALLIVVFILFRAIASPWEDEPQSQRAAAPDSDKVQVSSVTAPMLDPVAVEEAAAQDLTRKRHQERRALAMAKLLAAKDTGEQTQALISELHNLVLWWQNDVEPLMRSDQGRAIALDTERAKLFNITRDSMDIDQTARVAASSREQVKALMQPIEDALGDQTSVWYPNEAVTQQLRAIADPIELALGRMQSARMTIAALREASPESVSTSAATLEQTIRKMELEDARRRAKAIADEEHAARERMKERIALTHGMRIEQEGESELKRMLAEMAAARQQAELDVLAFAQKAEQDRARQLATLAAEKEKTQRDLLAVEAQSKEVTDALVPFLGKGYWQPGFGYGALHDAQKSGPTALISLGAIKAEGGLEPTQEGLNNLVKIANSKLNERPGWVLPSTDDEWNEIKRRQDMLRRLGPVMVELGMLQP